MDWSSSSDRDRAAAQAICRERIGRLGGELHAVVAEIPPVASGRGSLAGMPYVVKDMFANGVLAPTWGCSESPAVVSPRAPVLERLDGAGASLIATAEMTELAYEPSGYNPLRGSAINPWHSDFVTGGSSSGPAVLVASGCCYVALGSDSGGSVRIPAHCCGVTALKPSFGVIPVDGAMPLAPSLDTIGILARSAADLAQVWPVISGRAKNPSLPRLSAIILADAFSNSDADIERVCRQAIDVLISVGMTVTSRAGFPEEASRQALLVLQAEAARTHRARLHDARIDATLRKRLSKGLAISENELAASLAGRAALLADFLTHQLDGANVALLPVMPIKTPRVGEVDPSASSFNPRTLYAMSQFTRFANYLGLPALAVPAGWDERGMPVGLQIVGRPDSDALLLEIGVQLQARADWHGCVPSALVSDLSAIHGLARRPHACSAIANLRISI